MDPSARKPKGKPKRMEDLLADDSLQRTRAEKMRLGTIVMTAFIGLMSTAILGFSWRAWDNISTLSTEAQSAKAERQAIVVQNRNDKEMILQQLSQLEKSLAETKNLNSAAVTELRQANTQMQKDVTALAVKVDMISQVQREGAAKSRP